MVCSHLKRRSAASAHVRYLRKKSHAASTPAPANVQRRRPKRRDEKRARAVELLADAPEHIVRRQYMNGALEIAAEQHRLHGEPADHEPREWRAGSAAPSPPTGSRARMFLGLLVHALLAMESHEEHAERVQRGDEHACEHAEVRITGEPAVRVAYRVDQQILGEESRRTRESRSGRALPTRKVQ